MIKWPIEIPEFDNEEFETMCKFSHQTDVADFGKRRAKALGYDNEDLSISSGAIINYVPNEQIGKNVKIGLYNYIKGDVTIGDNVLIGPHCSIAAGNHKFDPETGWFSGRTENDYDNSIVIGEGSWLASNVTVTAGVKIGKANLICAGAVVTKSTPDYAIMAGVPAKQVGRINPKTGEYIWEK